MFRFTIRDLFWLTVVVALAALAWREHRLHEQTLREFELVKDILRMGGTDSDMELFLEAAKNAKRIRMPGDKVLPATNIQPRAPSAVEIASPAELARQAKD